MLLSTMVALSGCQSGPAAPGQEKAVLDTAAPFLSAVYGVPASPRVTDLKKVPKGGGRFQVGKPYKVRGTWYYPKEEPGYVASGKASWYGANFHGRLTANGEVYDMFGLSAAHPTFPLPSYARVQNITNGNQIVVRVNDRGPYAHGRVVDVSSRAAEFLGFKHSGVVDVKVEYLGRAPLEGDDTELLVATYRPAADQGPPEVMVASSEAGRLADAASPRAFGDTPPSTMSFSAGEAAAAIPHTPAQPAAAPRLPPVPSTRGGLTSYAAEVAVVGAERAIAAIGSYPTERIQIGTVTDQGLLRAVREVAAGQGGLVEEAVTVGGTDGFSLSLAVAPAADVDDLLRRFWRVGAADAFVVRY